MHQESRTNQGIFNEEIKKSPKMEVPILIKHKDFTIERDTVNSGNLITVPVCKTNLS